FINVPFRSPTPTPSLHDALPIFIVANESSDSRFELTSRNFARASATSRERGKFWCHIPQPTTLSSGGVRVLVGAPVFKTGEAKYLGLAGSIPVRLRHLHKGSLMTDPRRFIPRVDDILQSQAVNDAREIFAEHVIRTRINQVLGAARAGLISPQAVMAEVVAALVDASP